MKTICYFGQDWAGNIGNAFIDTAINYCLNKVLEGQEYQIHQASMLPAYLKYNFAYRKPFSWFIKNPSHFDMRQHMSPDFVVMGAALLDIYWTKIHHEMLEWLAEKKIKVIILGGGGGNKYSGEEKEYVKRYWRKINVVSFIARDYKCYENFKDIFTENYAGIDNAFFLKDAYKPAKLDIENLGVKTFDITYDRDIEFPEGFTVVSARHRAFDVDSIKFALRNGFKTFSIVGKTDLISESVDDYLNLYGNSKITHSDRVHACVATLSFGGRARYYDNSDRSYLFERVGLGNINKEIVQLDQEFIKEEKQKQLVYLKSVLSD